MACESVKIARASKILKNNRHQIGSTIKQLIIKLKLIAKKLKKGVAFYQIFARILPTLRDNADLAQLVEQLTCNQ